MRRMRMHELASNQSNQGTHFSWSVLQVVKNAQAEHQPAAASRVQGRLWQACPGAAQVASRASQARRPPRYASQSALLQPLVATAAASWPRQLQLPVLGEGM